MKSFIKTAFLGALACSSLAFSLPLNALTTQVNSNKTITTQTIFNPQSESKQKLSQDTEEQMIAQSVYCETRYVDGSYVSCCVDSYGNWACVW